MDEPDEQATWSLSSLGVSGANKALSTASGQAQRLMHWTAHRVLLKNKQPGLDFQKSEQEAPDHLSQQPHHLEDETQHWEWKRGVIILVTFKDPPPAPLSSSSFQSWHWECFFVFFALSVLTEKVHHISPQILLIPQGQLKCYVLQKTSCGPLAIP